MAQLLFLDRLCGFLGSRGDLSVRGGVRWASASASASRDLAGEVCCLEAQTANRKLTLVPVADWMLTDGLPLEEFPAANTWRWMLARCAPLTLCAVLRDPSRRVRFRSGRAAAGCRSGVAGVWAFHFQGRGRTRGHDGRLWGQHQAVKLPVGRCWRTVPVASACCGRGAPASLAPEQHTRNRNGRWERLPFHSRMPLHGHESLPEAKPVAATFLGCRGDD